GRVGPRLDAAFRYLVPAVDAAPVAAVLDAGQRGEHRVELAAGRVEHRLGAVVLGQHGPRVRGILRIARAGQRPGRLALQDGDRPVELVAHLFQALAGDGSLHRGPHLPPSGLISSGLLFRTKLTSVDTAYDVSVSPPVI